MCSQSRDTLRESGLSSGAEGWKKLHAASRPIADAPIPPPRNLRKSLRSTRLGKGLSFLIALLLFPLASDNQLLPDGDRLLAVTISGAAIPNRERDRGSVPRLERDPV